MTSARPDSASAASGVPSRPGPSAGTAVVLGVLLAAAALATFAVWFQWGQTRRCLEFFGPRVSRRIQAAPRVELWRLETAAGRLRVAARRDVSQAPGLVHLRRGLIEDVNYRWPTGHDRPANRMDEAVWDAALAFWVDAEGDPDAILAFDLDKPGSVTVVGQAGRVALGPLEPGLRRWIEATGGPGFLVGKSGF